MLNLPSFPRLWKRFLGDTRMACELYTRHMATSTTLAIQYWAIFQPSTFFNYTSLNWNRNSRQQRYMPENRENFRA